MKNLRMLLVTVAIITMSTTTACALIAFGESNILPIDVVTSVDEQGLPEAKTGIAVIYPNPFNPSTTIKFGLAESGHVELAVYDLKGQLVRILDKGSHHFGYYQATWNGQNDHGQMMPAGAYFCRLSTIDGSQVKKLTLVK